MSLIQIVITSQQVGTAHMYEFIGRKGRRTIVPTYLGVMGAEGTDHRFEFAVTRRSAEVVFGKRPFEDYGYRGECPPSFPNQPYHARVHETDRLGEAILLYEPWCKDQESLQGQGPCVRRGINIHFGPASSYGCMAVAGGKRGYRRLMQFLHRLKHNDGWPPIQVTVLPRND